MNLNVPYEVKAWFHAEMEKGKLDTAIMLLEGDMAALTARLTDLKAQRAKLD